MGLFAGADRTFCRGGRSELGHFAGVAGLRRSGRGLAPELGRFAGQLGLALPRCPNHDAAMSESRAPVAIHLKKATGAVEISEPEGRLTLLDRRLFNHLLAHAYRDLGKR